MTVHDFVTPARACGYYEREALCFAKGFASVWGLLLKSVQPNLYWQMTMYQAPASHELNNLKHRPPPSIRWGHGGGERLTHMGLADPEPMFRISSFSAFPLYYMSLLRGKEDSPNSTGFSGDICRMS